MSARITMAALLVVIVATVMACGDRKPADQANRAPVASGAPSAPPAAPPAEKAEAPLPPSALPAEKAEAPLPPSMLETKLPPAVREFVVKPFAGDLDEMVKRRVVRVGVTFNRTYYFIDRGVQRGVSYEYGQVLEERLNKLYKTGPRNKVYVAFIPLPRGMLLPALVEGKLDVVAAQVMIRPDLEKLVDFTNPTRMNVSEILVSGPGVPAMASVDDLSGREVFVRRTSHYRQSLDMLNEQFKAQGKPVVVIRDAPENLEDDDLLEMVNAGLIPSIVVDNYLAAFWKKIFKNLVVHEDVALRTGGTLAVAIRKSNPQLSAALNKSLGKYGLGTAFGNQIERKYLVNTKYAESAASETERQKFLTLVQLFRKYSEQYDQDYLLMAAQGYQESRLDQDAKSKVGAIGVMQVMPATGRELKVGDIRQAEANIHAGVKYMRVTSDTFFANEPMDRLNKGLFTFASYNAGPGRIRALRREAEKAGLNPNVWFGNVEVIAAERIGRETVTYVANIYKYYVAYRLVVEEMERRAAAKAVAGAKQVK